VGVLYYLHWEESLEVSHNGVLLELSLVIHLVLFHIKEDTEVLVVVQRTLRLVVSFILKADASNRKETFRFQISQPQEVTVKVAILHENVVSILRFLEREVGLEAHVFQGEEKALILVEVLILVHILPIVHSQEAH